MHAQKILFDGYIRIEILNNVSINVKSIMTTDVISVCKKFYTIDIKSNIDQCQKTLLSNAEYAWMKEKEFKQDAELFTLETFCDDLLDTKQCFL